MNHGLIVLASLAIAGPTFAQSAPTAAPPSPSASPPAADEATPAQDQDQGVKALRASCRDEADAKGLRGPAKREAVSACVVRQRPDLAGREQCRTEGFGKGLRKQELHAFVKDCAKAKS